MTNERLERRRKNGPILAVVGGSRTANPDMTSQYGAIGSPHSTQRDNVFVETALQWREQLEASRKSPLRQTPTEKGFLAARNEHKNR